MKRLFLVSLTVALLGSLIFSACAKPSPVPTTPAPAPKPTPAPSPSPAPSPPPSPAPAPKAVKLIFNSMSNENVDASIGVKWYLEEVAKRSGGLVTFEYHFSGELGGATEILKALQGGAIDLGTAAPAYNPSERSLSNLMNGTRVPRNSADALRAGYQIYWHAGKVSDILAAEDKTLGIKTVLFHPLEYYVLTKARIDKLADFKGMKMRSIGVYEPKMLARYGAISVNVPTGEWYEGLSRGTMDGIAIPYNSIVANKMHEVGKYISFEGGGIIGNHLVFGLNSYNKLPDKVKAIFEDDAFRKEAIEKQIEIFRKEFDSNTEKMKLNITYIKVDPKEQQIFWDDWSSVTIAEYPPSTAKLGKGPEGLAVLDKWLELCTGQNLAAWDKKLGITR